MALRRLSEASRRLLTAHALRELARCMLERSRVCSCWVTVACSQATVDALHVTQCAAPNASAERLGQLQEHAGPSSANTKEIWLEQAAASEAASAPSQQRANTRLAIRELITKQV